MLSNYVSELKFHHCPMHTIRSLTLIHRDQREKIILLYRWWQLEDRVIAKVCFSQASGVYTYYGQNVWGRGYKGKYTITQDFKKFEKADFESWKDVFMSHVIIKWSLIFLLTKLLNDLRQSSVSTRQKVKLIMKSKWVVQ